MLRLLSAFKIQFNKSHYCKPLSKDINKLALKKSWQWIKYWKSENMLISDKLKSENFCTVLSILYSLAFFLEGKEKKREDNNT